MRFSRLSKVLSRIGAFYSIGRRDYHHLPLEQIDGPMLLVIMHERWCGLIRLLDEVAAASSVVLLDR